MVELLGKDDSEKGSQSQLRGYGSASRLLGEETPGGGEDRPESWVLPLRKELSIQGYRASPAGCALYNSTLQVKVPKLQAVSLAGVGNGILSMTDKG